MENTKIKVLPIIREGSWLASISKSHDGRFMFTGTSATFTVPQDASGKLVDPLEGLSSEEILKIEKTLGLEEGDLNPYRQIKNFWKTNKLARVKLNKDGLILDTSNIIDQIKFLVLKSNKELIAPSWDDRMKKGTYKFCLVDKDQEIKDGSRKAEIMRETWMQFGKIEDSEAKLKGVLRLYLLETKQNSIKVPENTTKNFLISEVNKIIEKDPNIFLKIVKDDDFNVKSDISAAITSGYINKVGKAKYQFKDMPDEQFTYDELVSFLKSSENSDRYLVLKKHIK